MKYMILALVASTAVGYAANAADDTIKTQPVADAAISAAPVVVKQANDQLVVKDATSPSDAAPAPRIAPMPNVQPLK